MYPDRCSPGSLKKAGYAFLMILLPLLFGSAAHGNIIQWSSGSFDMTSSQCSGGDCSNDTLIATGDITDAGGKALDIAAGCDGLTCVFTGRTFEYSSIGISIHSNNITVIGGTFLDRLPSGDGHMGIKLQAHDILLKNVNCMVTGDNAIAVHAGGGDDAWNLEIDGGTFWSEGTGYESRCDYDAPVMKFEDMRTESSSSFQYHVYVHDVAITDGPWAGITVLGRTNDGEDVNQALAIIENNTITTDHQNDWYSNYSGLCLSSANPYGIIFRHVAPGSRIYGNTITSGTAHGGNRGINVERSKGTEGNPVIVRRNTINVHEGPNVEFGEDLPVHGLRVRYYNQYVLVDSNTVTISTDSNSGTKHTGSHGQAMRITVDRSDTYLTFRNNTITATALDAGIDIAACFVLDAVDYTDRISLYNNRLTSSNVIYQFGSTNGQDKNGTLNIHGDTVAFGGLNAGYKTFSLGWLCNSWVSFGNRARDVVYLGGTSPSDISFYCGGTGKYDMTIERTLNLYLRGNNGLPVVGASVTARNAYGQTVVSGTTDNGGRVSGVVSYLYDANGWFSDSTSFNNFTLTADKDGDSDANNSFTVGWTRAGGTDTLTLAGTAGTGEWGAVDPDPTDTTPPGRITNLNASTGPIDGSIGISWTAPGDDGNTGTARSYIIRYSTSAISESNWSSASTFSSPPFPSSAGTGQSTTITGLAPGVTYYVGIKTIDDFGNQSQLSNIATAVAKETDPGAVDQVSRVGSWTTGLTHAPGAGTDRLLIFAVGYENGTDPGVSAVTYGGRSLTQIGGAANTSGTYARCELWYLGESGISAASGSSFNVTWGGSAPTHPGYGAATYRNVNQANPILDVSTSYTNSETPNPITTTVNVIAKGMAVAVATCGNLDPYAWNNGWSEGFDQSVDGTMALSVADHLELNGGTSTASATNQLPNRQVIVATSLYPSSSSDPTDTTPPDAIIDLGAEPGGNDGEITLTWTATGDDGSSGSAEYYLIRYSTQLIDEDNWGSADVFWTTLTPGSASSDQTATVTGLIGGTSYYLAVKAADDNDNVSELSNVAFAVARHTIVAGGDTIPPGAVTDLIAQPGINDGEIYLAWTATGDDAGSGTADRYLIRYSVQSIDDGNWAQATEVENPPSPGLAGSEQTATLTGLVPGSRYYAALVAVDDDDNQSDLSNVTSALAKLTIVIGDEQAVAVSPGLDSTMNTSHPRLIVANVDSEVSSNMYYFEVAADSSFASLAAFSPPVPEEAGTTTVWRVDAQLSGDQVYFWRVRADDNPYSAISWFRVEPRVHAYPNPFIPGTMGEVVFAEIPDGLDLILMQVSGDVVRRWVNTTGDDIRWDGTNESGKPVASGTYLWFVENSDQKGKLIILR